MKNAISILKNIGVLTGAIATVWIVFVMYDTFKDNQIEQLQNDKVIIDNLNDFKGEVKISLDSINEKLMNIDKKQASLEGSFSFYRNNVDQIDKNQMEQIIIDAYGLGYATGKKKESIP